jgi:hypothetical protein
MPFETDSISQIVLKSDSLNLAKLNEQESFTALKQYLGPVQFDLDIMARQNKLFPPGLINILSASDYLGSVLTIECVEDLTHPEKKGNSQINLYINLFIMFYYNFRASNLLRKSEEHNPGKHNNRASECLPLFEQEPATGDKREEHPLPLHGGQQPEGRSQRRLRHLHRPPFLRSQKISFYYNYLP